MYFYYAQSSLFVFLCSHPVRRASANVVSIIAKYAIPAGEWPKLLPFLFQCSQSPQEDHREVSRFGEGLFLPCRCIYTVFILKNNELYVTISKSISSYFLCWFVKPNATLLLYPGLGPAMLRRLRRESLPVSIGGVHIKHRYGFKKRFKTTFNFD